MECLGRVLNIHLLAGYTNSMEEREIMNVSSIPYTARPQKICSIASIMGLKCAFRIHNLIFESQHYYNTMHYYFPVQWGVLQLARLPKSQRALIQLHARCNKSTMCYQKAEHSPAARNKRNLANAYGY